MCTWQPSSASFESSQECDVDGYGSALSDPIVVGRTEVDVVAANSGGTRPTDYGHGYATAGDDGASSRRPALAAVLVRVSHVPDLTGFLAAQVGNERRS